MPIELGNPKSKKTANVQYTYPASNVQLIEGKNNYSFFLYNSGSQSFSFTDMTNSITRYISGVSTNASITKKNHNISRVAHNAELVITHKTMNGSTFYVVVPLNHNSTAKTSQIDLILDSDEKTTTNFDLNIDLDNPNIIYYQLADNTDVFVFDKAISVKTDKINNLDSSDIFTTIKEKTTPIKITSHSKVEDEIECNYEGETDATAKPADVTTVNKIFIWGCALIGILFFLLFGLTNIENNYADQKNNIYMLLGFIGFLLFLIFIGMLSAKSNTTSLNITYSSLTLMSLMFIVLSYLAQNKYFA